MSSEQGEAEGGAGNDAEPSERRSEVSVSAAAILSQLYWDTFHLQSGTPLDETPAHRRALFEHVGVWYIAQGHRDSALNGPHLSILHGHVRRFACRA